MAPRRKSALTVEEQLAAFLLKWEQVRAALVAKYNKEAEHWATRTGCSMIVIQARRKVAQHQHELDMLVELRRRAFLPDSPYREP